MFKTRFKFESCNNKNDKSSRFYARFSADFAKSYFKSNKKQRKKQTIHQKPSANLFSVKL